MKTPTSFISGLAGAVAVTALHETLKRTVNNAPRMDKLGEEGLTKVLSATGSDIPSEQSLYELALGGDLLSNAGYYAMVGFKPKYSLLTGAALGLAVGIGAVTLPSEIGLTEKYSAATKKTKLLTVMLYVAGGLVAGAVYRAINKDKR